MNKLGRTLAVAAIMAGASGAAHATEGWYGRVDAGYSTDGALEVDEGGDFDFDSGWAGFAGLGYAFQNGFRLEGELSHRDNEFSDFEGDARAWAAMANLYYDFNRGGTVEPYIGAGVGQARISTEGIVGPVEWDDDDSVLAYQAMVGVAIALTERLDLDVGYLSLIHI